MNLAIWGDDDWLDCTPPAQHLYHTLWHSPGLSYCGAGEWHPGKISTKAKDWTPEAVEAAAVELSRDLFLIIDEVTGEFLIRSWVKHDGLWKIPNMAVSMANARAELASRTLRGVVVHEVLKIRAANPGLSSWQREAVVSMLSQKPVDPATLEPFNPRSNPSANPSANPWAKGWPNPSVNPSPNPPVNENPRVGVNPTANPGPTPAPSPAPFLQGGYVSTEGNVARANDDPTPPPSHCPQHPDGSEAPCGPCGDARRRRKAWDAEQERLAIEARKEARRIAAQERRRAIDECDLCDEDGYVGKNVCGHVRPPESRPSLRSLYQQARTEKGA
ncbi:hypothetical protein OED52_13805 [Rhodococcus sp. Z13]|uniref:Uncharacterized protein n=1 Tax=Rhodococcus sacchari TaxID=2962047 RepID=A0ACD4DCE5_9NOCA|nr:hypothetical protein [Rhodococcus sp. Z13]UYP17747.1 hypothetical protein OED52_13805 [Rhodococcus sp. Z13]